MANLDAILQESGLTFDNIVKTTVLLADMGDFATVNEVYGAPLCLMQLLWTSAPQCDRMRLASILQCAPKHCGVLSFEQVGRPRPGTTLSHITTSKLTSMQASRLKACHRRREHASLS